MISVRDVARQHDVSFWHHADVTTSEYSRLLMLGFDWLIIIGNRPERKFGVNDNLCMIFGLESFALWPNRSRCHG